MRNDDDHVEERLRKLKKTYDTMPSFSDPEKMARRISHLKTERQIANRSRRTPFYVAISAVAIVMLAILTIPFVSNNESAHPFKENSESISEEQTEQLIRDGDKSQPKANTETKFVIDRPETKVDSLHVGDLTIEGMPEKMVFTLVIHEKHKFSTYYPEDMLVTINEDRLKIIANFGNVKNEDAYVELLGVNTNESDTERLLADFHNYVMTEKNESEFIVPYAAYEYLIENDEYVGTIAFFERDGTLYRLTIHYPVEMGDGFGPRSVKIVDDLQFHPKL